MWLKVVCPAFCVALTGCAHLEFAQNPQQPDRYVPFYEQTVYMSVNKALLADGQSCGFVGQLFMMTDPSKKHFVRPVSGYGNNNLTAAFANGALSSFGQQTDTTKAASDVATLAGLVAAGPAGAAAAKTITTTGTAGSAGLSDFAAGSTVTKTETTPVKPPDCKPLAQSALYRFTGTSFELVQFPISTGGTPITINQVIGPAASGAADTPKTGSPKQ